MISIHAPGWGATNKRSYNKNRSLFQSTHPGGVRLIIYDAVCDRQSFQSTHPGGVRRTLTSSCTYPADFNPRTRVGCDHLLPVIRKICKIFQSTHPGGVRPAGCDSRFSRGCEFQSTHPGGVRPFMHLDTMFDKSDFNPRTRVGCDPQRSSINCKLAAISIHAPGWGATKEQHLEGIVAKISIHAPGWGATG